MTPAPDIREETIFSLLKASAAQPSTRATWVGLGVLVLAGWIGAVAFIGQFRRHQLVELLYAVASADSLYWGP